MEGDATARKEAQRRRWPNILPLARSLSEAVFFSASETVRLSHHIPLGPVGLASTRRLLTRNSGTMMGVVSRMKSQTRL